VVLEEFLTGENFSSTVRISGMEVRRNQPRRLKDIPKPS